MNYMHGRIRALTRGACQGGLVEVMARPGFEVIVGGVIRPGGAFRGVIPGCLLRPGDGQSPAGHLADDPVQGNAGPEGIRGMPAQDVPALIDVIVGVSEVIATGRFRTVDLNPVVVHPSGTLVLDAKMARI